jgi:hypothetical protein
LETYQSAHDDLALSKWCRQADSGALSSTSDWLSVLLDASDRGLGGGSLGRAAATTSADTATLAARLGDVLKGLVELGRHFRWRLYADVRVEIGFVRATLSTKG